jgi:hypothetical protein
MKKKLKIILICISVILIIALGGILTIRSGILVRPTNNSLAKRTEVPHFDRLEWQFERELEILADYGGAKYTFSEPYIIIDPYLMNPLSALILFETDNSGSIEVTVQGDDEFTTFIYTHNISAPRAEIPILGLYAGRTNKVILNIDGEISEHEITTDPLPVTMQSYTLVSSQPEKMAEGITLFIAFFENSYSALVDSNGDVRGFITMPDMAKRMPLTLLRNGNILAAGEEYKQTPYNMASLIEYNWLGKIFKEYMVPHAVHHGVFELPNRDFLITANHIDMIQTGTREDVAVIMNRQTGKIIKEYDYRKIVDETRYPFHYFDPPIINAPSRDWMHMNAVIYDGVNHAVIASSPTQSMVISINADTEDINWILGPHDGWGEEFHQYLLTPVGDDFEWQWCQHDPSILPDYNNNPDTIDILLFDNGQAKSFYEETSIRAEDNYSRAVIYRINHADMTVEQLWQYGKERGSELYAAFLGGAQYLSNSNILIAFGGMLRGDDKPMDEVISGVFGHVATRSRVVEVTQEGEVVFEVSVRESPGTSSAETYQAKRLPLFVPESFDYRLGEIKAERLGTGHFISQTDEISPPNLYVGNISADIHDIYRIGYRLIIDGTLLHKGERQLIGRAFLIFRDRNGNAYTYAAISSINARFLAAVDLTELPAGVYQIDIAGGVVEGNDALGERIQGHFRTEYKITVD